MRIALPVKIAWPLLFVMPILEMYLLIQVGGQIGAWPTIGLVLLAAVIGVLLLRVRGLATLTRGLHRLQAGELPAREVAEGMLLAVAAALLIVPGFVTDAFALALLLPALRARVTKTLLAQMTRSMSHDGPHDRPGTAPGTSPAGASPGRDPLIIEGDYEVRDPPP